MTNNYIQILKNNARVVLDKILKDRQPKIPTEDEANFAVDKAIEMIRLGDVDAAAQIDDKAKALVIAYLFYSYSRKVGDPIVLQGDHKSHIEWLYERRATIDWDHWNRYRQYMLDVESMPDPVVAKVNTITDQILELLEDPKRKGMWTVRGLVVGSVQSGKTANYCGVINKAVDAGYKLIIVVAGVHDNLRSQTQARIDLGVAGKDTREGSTTGTMYGVGEFDDAPVLHQLTTFEKDFGSHAKQGQNVSIGSDPVILVVKKNASILRNLREWVAKVAKSPKPENLRRPNREDGDKDWIAGCPMLLIDDEADHASINTSLKDRTATNRELVELLTIFQQSSYVGYTATPYANLFADPDDIENIFPRNFIINIPAPDNYVGVSKVFGSDDDPDNGIEGVAGLPIVRDLNKIDKDYELHVPPKHKIDFVPKSLPQSLKDAIKVFIITCAVRNVRRRTLSMSKHDSMLVHLSRFMDVMNRYFDLIQAEKDTLEHGIRAGSQSVIDDFKAIWEDDFKKKTFSEMPLADQCLEVAWESVVEELPHVLRKVTVRNIHGESGHVLDYDKQRENGLCVIAIGGDKLSRGLTLESLSVSYFLRTSKMYDTLMQMGRWFGYKDGYIDLCRIYTSKQLIDWYKHIALADRELRSDFVKMSASKSTPIDYGLKVRSHPHGLRITALSKMRTGKKRLLSFAYQLVQTSKFEKASILNNFNVFSEFFCSIDGWKPHNNYLVKRNVNRAQVRDFIFKLSIPYGTNLFTKQALLAFLDKQQLDDSSYAEKWTIACASKDSSRATDPHQFNLAGQKIVPIRRRIAGDDFSGPEFLSNRQNILSPSDQSMDVDLDQITSQIAAKLKAKKGLKEHQDLIDSCIGKTLGDLAFELTKAGLKTGEKAPDRANGSDCRLVRSENEALLIIYPFIPTIEKQSDLDVPKPVIGLAISFAASENASAVEFITNKVFEKTFQGSVDPDLGFYNDDEESTEQLRD